MVSLDQKAQPFQNHRSWKSNPILCHIHYSCLNQWNPIHLTFLHSILRRASSFRHRSAVSAETVSWASAYLPSTALSRSTVSVHIGFWLRAIGGSVRTIAVPTDSRVGSHVRTLTWRRFSLNARKLMYKCLSFSLSSRLSGFKGSAGFCTITKFPSISIYCGLPFKTCKRSVNKYINNVTTSERYINDNAFGSQRR